MLSFKDLSHNVDLIGFDLDDTLWDNRQTIINANEAMFKALASHMPQHSVNEIKTHYTVAVEQLVQSDPIRYENVTIVRQHALAKLCQDFSLDAQVAELAFNQFFKFRQFYQPYPQALPLLKHLSQSFTLVALSNGNVELSHSTLAPFFKLHWQGGVHGRAKPHPDMLLKACEHFNTQPSRMIYVGDNPSTDHLAAIAAGAHSVLVHAPSKPDNAVCFETLEELVEWVKV